MAVGFRGRDQTVSFACRSIRTKKGLLICLHCPDSSSYDTMNVFDSFLLMFL